MTLVVPAMAKRASREALEVPSLAKKASREALEVPSMAKKASREALEVPSLAKKASCVTLEVPATGEKASSLALEAATESLFTLEPNEKMRHRWHFECLAWRKKRHRRRFKRQRRHFSQWNPMKKAPSLALEVTRVTKKASSLTL